MPSPYISTPHSLINPYPPATMPAMAVIQANPPVHTLTPQSEQAPATPSETAMTVFTDTPFPTETPTPTSSIPTPMDTFPTAAPAGALGSEYAYIPQSDPIALSASVLNPDRQECNWMGVGGRVLDLQGRPVVGIRVQMGGILDKKKVDANTLSGTAPNYGDSGYEFQLSDFPIASKKTLWVRLWDQSNLPLSDQMLFRNVRRPAMQQQPDDH